MKKIKTTPKLRNGIVVYIDFLGSTSIIVNNEMRNCDEDPFLSDIIEIYNTSIMEFETHSMLSDIKYGYKIFSDNIALSVWIEKNATKEKITNIIGELLGFVGYFQGEALLRGYKTRGAICYGKYYLNSDLIWGKALVEAVTLEEKESCYPRVLLSETLIDYIKSYTTSDYEAIKKDDDKKVYCDFLWYFNGKKEELSNIISNLKSENKILNKDTKIVKKNNWILNKIKKYQKA